MNTSLDWFSWILLLLVLAAASVLVTGGLVRSISPIPRDGTFRAISRTTWWVSPSLVAAAGVCAAWATRGRLAASLAVAGLTLVGLVLAWRWRPSRAERLWVPRWLARVRTAVPVPIRDSAAWRRQVVQLVVGGLVLLVSYAVLRR